MKKLLILSYVILTGITVNARSVNSNFRLKLHIQNNLNIISTYVVNSNVFIKYANKSTRQLTFSNADSSPIILKKENAILFIRNAAGDYNYPNVKKIMKVNCNSLIEKTLTDKKPFKDAVSDTYYILNIQNPTFSLDEQHLYFGTECYVTGNELVKVDVTTGKWSRIFPANDFELIKRGQFKGLFLIGRSEIKGAGGRSIYYYLVNEKNETLKEFDSEDNFRLFKKNAIKN
jgi:hypothetical protein